MSPRRLSRKPSQRGLSWLAAIQAVDDISRLHAGAGERTRPVYAEAFLCERATKEVKADGLSCLVRWGLDESHLAVATIPTAGKRIVCAVLMLRMPLTAPVGVRAVGAVGHDLRAACHGEEEQKAERLHSGSSIGKIGIRL